MLYTVPREALFADSHDVMVCTLLYRVSRSLQFHAIEVGVAEASLSKLILCKDCIHLGLT